MSTPVITFDKVCKTFGDFTALDHVTFTINKGDFFALLGPNGAGKTTLISILTGLQRATQGSVQVLGYDVVNHYQQTRRSVGSVPQELVFDPFFTVREALVFQSGYYGIRDNNAWIDQLLQSLYLTDKAHVNTRNLSGGMKRRLMVALALVHRPPVIVLDEPTAGVDVELRRELWKFIRQLNQQGHTILLTTHYLQEAEELSNRIGMMKQGRIVTLADKDVLIKSYAAQILRLRTSVSSETLRTFLDPIAVIDEGAWQAIHIKHSHEVEQILHRIHTNGIEINDMQMGPADLEDIFMQVLGNTVPANASVFL